VLKMVVLPQLGLPARATSILSDVGPKVGVAFPALVTGSAVKLPGFIDSTFDFDIRAGPFAIGRFSCSD